MRKIFLWATRVFSLTFLACVGQAGHAGNLIEHSLSFEDVEGRFANNGRMAEAETALQAAVPIGSSAAQARVTLEKAGARCAPQWHRPQDVLCVYRQRTTVDDYYQADIVWTAALHVGGARVLTLLLDREVDKH
ncbi:hypothetical protein OLX02_13265 [Novosphingobium sp. KCTC 2891]|uniref:hypothetical protein n=1 Tax=Novosphingobium sp. KCTC 2891 TaxID=2989730 RepID=UPI0022237D88|nr:hypothetical protein [Novosphingobium sp. KCTC 2891]MCW1383792.1 hypothetical protein [Novosphingobium sp. KCTC 2891]